MKQMKNLCVLLATSFLSLAPLGLHAQDWAHRGYINFDGGPFWMMDTTVKDVFGPVPAGSEMSFETGGRFGITFGYHVTDWFSGEFETAFLANGVKHLDYAQSFDANVFTVPLMLNARFQLPTHTRFVPYIGGGLGGMSSVLDVDHLDYLGSSFSGSASDIVFAAQAIAGFQVAISQHVGMGLEYRFLYATGPQYEVDWGWYWNVYSDHIELGDMIIHMASIHVDVTF